MLFLVVENYIAKYYGNGDGYTEVYTLGVYSTKKAAEERIQKEHEKIHDNEDTKGNLYIIELETDADCCKKLCIL